MALCSCMVWRCAQNWHPLRQALRAHRLIVVDLRGHGHSNQSREQVHTSGTPVTCSSCLKS